MGTLGAIGMAWERYCRRLEPQEAGALWGLVSMALCSRVKGCVVARAGVLAAAWNLGEGEPAEKRAVEILTALKKKGAVAMCPSGEAWLVTVTMFGDRWEKRRETERARHAVRENTGGKSVPRRRTR